MGQPEHCTPETMDFAKNSHCDPLRVASMNPVGWSLRVYSAHNRPRYSWACVSLTIPTWRNTLTQQNGTPKQRSKFPQYIAPIIILLLAIGAAVYGVLWANSDDDASAPTEETAQNDQTERTQASTHLDDVQREFPDEDAAHQEALAVARGEMETYMHSE